MNTIDPSIIESCVHLFRKGIAFEQILEAFDGEITEDELKAFLSKPRFWMRIMMQRGA